jgi:TolB-like protein/DNA-binding winged helix-turn-helix (wHTH) protein/tetratricopeptide (TPR) repeat protein
MSEGSKSPRVIRFAVFELDTRTGELRKAGVRVALREQSYRLLCVLLERPGNLVTREELRARLWPADTFVDFEQGLNGAVKRLRHALGDSAETPRFIQTLPRRGYRFIASTSSDPQAPAPAGLRWPRRAAGAAAGVALLAACVVMLTAAGDRARPTRASGAARITSLAVLPLENMSRDPGQEYFVEGMHEALITHVARLSGLERVIARPSMVRYRNTSKPLREIAEELGVDALVTGAAMQDGGRVRVTAQLIRGSTENVLWAGSYERERRDAVSLQGELVAAIVEGIELELTPRERVTLTGARAVDPEAYEEYLRGRFHLNRFTHANYKEAIAHLQHAVKNDPGYAPAHAALAYAYGLIGGWGDFDPRDWLPRAEESSLRALRLDDRLAEAHVSRAWLQAYYEWDWAASEASYRTAIELDPGYAEGHHRYAILLSRLGRHDEARARIDRARQLDPFSVPVSNNSCWIAFMARDFDRAAAECRRTLEWEPNYALALHQLSWVYALVGRHAEAVELAQRAAGVSSDAYGAGHLGMIYAAAGRRQDAQRVLDGLLEQRQREYVPPINIAMVYLGLGQSDRAMDWLDRAYDERSGRLANLNVQPLFDPLRAEPRFQALLARMNFPRN